MAYPYSYTPYAQPYPAYQPQVQQQPAYQAGIVWVSGFEEASAVDHLCNIIKACEEEEGGYSSRGYAYGMDHSVEPGRDMSYARGRRNAPRDSMGRYSGEMGYSRHGDPTDQLRELMEQAPDEQTRRDLERIAQRMER